jgi:AbrB family looped-hinge helix DNA binding protein
MNHSAKVMAEGQVTLPAEVLDALGVKPGDRVDFVSTAGGAFELRPLATAPSDLSRSGVGLTHLKGLFGSRAGALDVDESIFETVRRRTDPNRSELDP